MQKNAKYIGPGQRLFLEKEILPGYNFQLALDTEFVRELLVDFPNLDVLEEIKTFRWYYDRELAQEEPSRLHPTLDGKQQASTKMVDLADIFRRPASDGP